MTHAAHLSLDMAGRGFQVAGLVVGAIQQNAAICENRRLSDLEAVEHLVAELDRARRIAAQAQSETRRLRAQIAAHANAAAAQGRRADRAEAACVRYATALGLV